MPRLFLLLAALLTLASALPQGPSFAPLEPDETTKRTGITFTPVPTSNTGVSLTPIPTTTVISTPITFTPTPTPSKTTVVVPKETLCVAGGRGVEIGGYNIDYALAPVPAGFPRVGGYKLSEEWEKRHQIGSMSMTMGVEWSAYGEFKCQYACNTMKDCVSFAGWSVRERSQDAYFECHLYDALITSDAYTRVGFDITAYTLDSFNKICSSRKREINKREEEAQEEEEAIFTKAGSSGWSCADEVACPIRSECAGLGLIEARPADAWESYYLSGEWVLANRWAGFVQEAEFSEESLEKVEKQCKLACIKNLGKCSSFTVAYGYPDPNNAYPDSILSENPAQGFICNLLSRNIDPAQYHIAVKAKTWTHFKGVNIACTNPIP